MPQVYNTVQPSKIAKLFKITYLGTNRLSGYIEMATTIIFMVFLNFPYIIANREAI